MLKCQNASPFLDTISQSDPESKDFVAHICIVSPNYV